MSIFSYLTKGLSDIYNNFAPVLANGVPVSLYPTPKLNAGEDPALANLTDRRLNLSPSQTASLQLASLSQIKDPFGNIILPIAGGFESLGINSLGFDPTTTTGTITPALSVTTAGSVLDIVNGFTETYTGADVRLMIECAEPNPGCRYAKQLLEATTISVSVHREVAPVRAGGYINPKGFALGKRTIAGTIILTQFTVEVLLQFMQDIMLNDGSKDTIFSTIDQLPPFNITMLFGNEKGYASIRRLLGVKFVTDGTVYSIQDMLSEQTLSWMATAFTPLMPFHVSSLYSPPNLQEANIKSERTPIMIMQQALPPSTVSPTLEPLPTEIPLREDATHVISFGDTIIGETVTGK